MRRSRAGATTLALRIACATACLLPGAARGDETPWPAGLQVASEADIEQAWQDGDLDGDTRDALLTLLQQPVDLAAAGRDELYALPGLTWEQVDAILAQRDIGALRGPDDLARIPGIGAPAADRVAPFVVFDRDHVGHGTRARVAAGTIWRTNARAPGTWLQSEVEHAGRWKVGVMLAVRPRNGAARSAAPGQSIALPRKSIRFDPAGLYASVEGTRWTGILGTYRVGFGQRLTLDNSRRSRPDGWYPALDVAESTETGSVSTPDGFWGGAVRYRGGPGRRGHVDATVFASYRLLDVPIADIYYDRCPAGQPDCPETRRVPAAVDITGQSLSCDYPTLPWAMHEALGGAHIAYRFDARRVVGATGYVGWRRFGLRAPGLRPAISSRFPWDRSVFGAAGLHGAWGRGPFDAVAEVTVTDRGAPAAFAAAWIRPAAGVQIRLSFRYYATGFDNPYARAESDADMFQGNRGRNEVGGRLDLDWQALSSLSIRTVIDLWHHRFASIGCDPSDESGACNPLTTSQGAPAAVLRPSTDLAYRFEARIRPLALETLALAVEYRDEDLAKSGRRLSYAAYQNVSGDWSGGARVRWSVSASTTRVPRTRFAATFRQTFTDVYALQDRFDRSWAAWLDARTDLDPGPAASLRVRFTEESAVADPVRSATQICASENRNTPRPASLPARCRGETALSVRLQLTQRIALPAGREVAIRLQGDWTRWFDDRARWRYGTACDAHPPRNLFGVRVALKARF